MKSKTRADEIMDLAECAVRASGYRGFTFRDLAAAANVKSSSIHYHFSTKEQLGLAIARRYAERTAEALGSASDPAASADEKMATFIELFRSVTTRDGQVCLFLIYGTELSQLPQTIQEAVREFFQRSLDWLAELLTRFESFQGASRARRYAAARAIIAALDGAMVMCRVEGNLASFETIVGELKAKGLIPSAGAGASSKKPRRKVSAGR